MKPVRVQYKRTRGYRLPPNTIYVGRRCRECGTSLYPGNISPSRVRKSDWICIKCNRQVIHQKWWNKLTPQQRSEVYKRANLKRVGLTKEEISEILIRQGYLCPICGNKLGVSKLTNQFGAYDYVLDHDHRKNSFRGVICPSCNAMLGYSKDNPQTLRAGAEYLETRVLSGVVHQ